jgi:hypothetical protein
MSKTRSGRSDPEKERRWGELVRGQQLSGQSVRGYCREAGVKESAFYWWRRELARRSETRKAVRRRPVRGRKAAGSSPADGRRRSGASNRRGRPGRGKRGVEGPAGDGSPRQDASPFVPIHLLADGSAAIAATVEIHLGDGRMVRVGPGVDRQTLREVLAALEVRPC